MKLTAFLIIVLSFSSLFAQQNEKKINSKLYVKYDKAYLEGLQNTDPEQLDYLNFYADNCYRFMPFPEDKPIPYQMLYKIDPKSKEYIEVKTFDELEMNFNPFEYNCKTEKEKPVYYKIGDTGQMVMMRSEKELSLRYRAHKSQK